MTTIRAWDEFEDLRGRHWQTGILHWGLAVEDTPLVEGQTECSPHQSVGWISAGEGDAAVAMSIGVDSFGQVTKLLAAERAEIRSNQPLMEFQERGPTTEEWDRQ